MRISDWSSDVCSSDLCSFPALLPCSEVHCRPFRVIVRPRLFSVAVVVCGGRELLDDDLAIARAGFHSTGLCRMKRLYTPSGISLPVFQKLTASRLEKEIGRESGRDRVVMYG